MNLVIAAGIGLVIALIDIVPMVVRKLPRYSTVAAFIHYFTASVIIMLVDIPGLVWWLKGVCWVLCS